MRIDVASVSRVVLSVVGLALLVASCSGGSSGGASGSVATPVAAASATDAAGALAPPTRGESDRTLSAAAQNQQADDLRRLRSRVDDLETKVTTLAEQMEEICDAAFRERSENEFASRVWRWACP